MINIAVLTSSRADFGIYFPLLHALQKDNQICLSIIAFGTHLSRYHGYTLNQIEESGFKVDYTIDSLLLGDTPEAISTAAALTSLKFSTFWDTHAHKFNLVFCLGDRFEMFAAVYAGIPFGVKFAHIHGGETTLGAIDDIYRHSITLASKYHFTATDFFAKKIKSLIGTDKNIYVVGSVSLDNLSKVKLLDPKQFFQKWGIDLTVPTILVTFHPQTVDFKNIEEQSNVFIKLLKQQRKKYQILITLPNIDTTSSIIREKILLDLGQFENIYIHENLGRISYFSALKYCSFILGNSSSGIIEAASFGKYVINIGDRQKGRLRSENVLDNNFHLQSINTSIKKIEALNYQYFGNNVYQKKNVIKNIISTLKNLKFDK